MTTPDRHDPPVGDPVTPLLTALFAEVYQAHRLDLVEKFYAPDHVEHDPLVGSDRAAVRRHWEQLLTGFPDLTATVDLALRDNDRYMAFVTWRGHQTGPFAGRGASGAALKLHTSELFRVADDRIVEHWSTVDHSVLATFGVQPPAAGQPPRPGLSGPHTAAEQANARLVSRAYDEVMSRHLLDRADDYYEPEYRHHNMQQPELPDGLAAFKAFFAANFAAFPDITARIDHLLAAGDRVMVFTTWRGHFTGEFFGTPPTGQELVMHASDQFRIGAGGKVAEHWEVVDYAGLQAAGLAMG